MSVQTIRTRDLSPSRRARAPRLGGAGEARSLDLVFVATLAVSAVTAIAILAARALAAVG